MERRRATNAESCRFESCRGYQIERTWPNGEAPGRQSGDASSILAVRSTLSHEYAGTDGRADGCNPSPRDPAPWRTPEAWALSTSGSAPALQAGWCGFEPRRVHQDRRLVAQWNESVALRMQRSRVRISRGRPVSSSSWRSGRSRSPSKREDVGSNPTDETMLLRRRSMAGRSALTRVMVVRVHPSQPGSWPRSSVEEQLGPNETVAGSNPAGAPNVFVAFWLSTTGRAPGC
jgi:hypothetical protein